MSEVPAWLAPHLEEGERVVWSQDMARGGVWMAVGPLVGAGFALAFAGSSVTDLPGPFEWLFGWADVPERLGVPAWLLWVVGAVGFVGMVARAAVVEGLSAWAVTQRRLLRVVRFAPFLSREWPLRDVRVERVRLRRRGASVELRVPGPWWRPGWLDVRARERASVFVAALERPRAPRAVASGLGADEP